MRCATKPPTRSHAIERRLLPQGPILGELSNAFDKVKPHATEGRLECDDQKADDTRMN
jgi:hypothetical protein